MSDLARRLADLISKRDALRREEDEARGALRQCVARLRQEFGCASLEDAKKLLAKLKKEREKLEREVREKAEAMEAEYGDLLRE